MKKNNPVKRLFSHLRIKLSERLSKERREKRKAAKLVEMKRFLREFFEGQPVAFEEDLCRSWEFWVTRLIYRWFPKYVERKITALSKDVASIDYIADLEPAKLERPQTVRDLTAEKSKEQASQEKLALDSESNPFDQAFVNYHSVCFWHRRVRYLVVNFLLMVPSAVIVPFLLSFVLGVSRYSSTYATYGTVKPEETNPGIAYTVPVSGTYYVEVKDTTPGSHDYHLWVVESSPEVVSPDFSQTSVESVSHGSCIFSRVEYPQQHLYRVQGNVGKKIVVHLDHWYADNDLDFALLDSEMDECDTASLLKSDLDDRDKALSCVVASTGPYYIWVQLREASVGASSKYGVKVYQVLDSAEREPNNYPDSSTEIPQDALITGTLSALDRDWYRFTAEADKRLEIRASGLSDSPLSSLTLYRPTASGHKLVAHSTSALSQNRS